MAFVSQQPYVDANGFSYPFFAVQIIISPRLEGANVPTPVLVNLRPYRALQDGTLVEPPADERMAAMKSVHIADAYRSIQHDPVLAAAMTKFLEGIGVYIQAKGL
jgi:hypothetical protein